MSNTKPTMPGNPAEPYGEKRRTQRVHIAMPVVVKDAPGAETFKPEDTLTISVNAFGGLLRVASALKRGQKFIIVNPRTQEEVLCLVIFVGQKEGVRTQVGFEFVQPAPSFWRIVFPPEDWDPAERKRADSNKPAGPLPKPSTGGNQPR